MLKLLVLVLVVVLVLWLMKAGRSGRNAPPRGEGGTGRRDGPQPMVACAHCGVHLPRADALLLGERAYCCAEHRDAGARAR